MTYAGEGFASRVAASLLGAVGLPEMVAKSIQDFENLAVYYGDHPQELLLIRNKLQNNRLGSALFDSKVFTKNLESLYCELMDY